VCAEPGWSTFFGRDIRCAFAPEGGTRPRRARVAGCEFLQCGDLAQCHRGVVGAQFDGHGDGFAFGARRESRSPTWPGWVSKDFSS
jgi:hypothetical protein